MKHNPAYLLVSIMGHLTATKAALLYLFSGGHSPESDKVIAKYDDMIDAIAEDIAAINNGMWGDDKYD